MKSVIFLYIGGEIISGRNGLWKGNEVELPGGDSRIKLSR